MTSFVKRTLVTCALTSAVESVLIVSMADPILLLGALGPPLFLVAIAWRRRAHLARSRRLVQLAIGVGAFGIAAFGVVALQFHTSLPADRAPGIAPLAVPLVQWVAVLFVWLAIAREESREKRA